MQYMSFLVHISFSIKAFRSVQYESKNWNSDVFRKRLNASEGIQKPSNNIAKQTCIRRCRNTTKIPNRTNPILHFLQYRGLNVNTPSNLRRNKLNGYTWKNCHSLLAHWIIYWIYFLIYEELSDATQHKPDSKQVDRITPSLFSKFSLPKISECAYFKCEDWNGWGASVEVEEDFWIKLITLRILFLRQLFSFAIFWLYGLSLKVDDYFLHR